MGNCVAVRPVRPSNAKEGNIIDNARSYKSKIGGMKLVLRNNLHRRDLIKFLQKRGKNRYIEAYDELVKLRTIPDVAVVMEEIKKMHAKYPVKGLFVWDKTTIAIGTCLEPIRFGEDESLNLPSIMKNIQWAEESVLAGITAEFEEFIQSQAFTRRGTIRVEPGVGFLSTSLSTSSKSGKDEDIRQATGTKPESGADEE
jgi:hypothetical protein